LPIYKDCLIKTKNNPELKSVYDYDERIKILQGAYSVIPDDISGKALLLVDDLYRSGATLRVVTEALKNEGRAGSIYVMVFTKTRKIK
jgi:predicted amidophosphoribosyltransferase